MLVYHLVLILCLIRVLIGAAGAKQGWSLTQKSQFISGNIRAMLILPFPSLAEETNTSLNANEGKALPAL